MNADERQELPQWIEGLIANHPRMVATEEAAQPFIIPGCFWNDNEHDIKTFLLNTPAEVTFEEGMLCLRGTPPGFTTPIEVVLTVDELVELTVFALCSESDEEEDEEE